MATDDKREEVYGGVDMQSVWDRASVAPHLFKLKINGQGAVRCEALSKAINRLHVVIQVSYCTASFEWFRLVQGTTDSAALRSPPTCSPSRRDTSRSWTPTSMQVFHLKAIRHDPNKLDHFIPEISIGNPIPRLYGYQDPSCRTYTQLSTLVALVLQDPSGNEAFFRIPKPTQRSRTTDILRARTQDGGDDIYKNTRRKDDTQSGSGPSSQGPGMTARQLGAAPQDSSSTTTKQPSPSSQTLPHNIPTTTAFAACDGTDSLLTFEPNQRGDSVVSLGPAIAAGRLWTVYNGTLELLSAKSTVQQGKRARLSDESSTGASVSSGTSGTHTLSLTDLSVQLIPVVVKFCRPASNETEYSPELARTAIENEIRAYTGPLRSLQGKVVPRFYGCYRTQDGTVDGDAFVMVLEKLGQGLDAAGIHPHGSVSGPGFSADRQPP